MSSKISKPRSPCDAEISCDWILVLASSDSLELNLKRFWSSAASAVLTKSHLSPDNSLSVHLSLVGFPNQMLYAKYFSSVLSPSMTRSPAVMLSPHQWSMPCPILSPTFCFSYQASAPHIILCHWNTHFKHSNFWHHGGKGGEVRQNGKGWGSWKRPWAMKKIR